MRSLLYIVLAVAADVLYECDKQTNGSYPYPKEKCLEVFCDIVIDTNDKLNLSDSTVFDMVYRDMLSLDYCKLKIFEYRISEFQFLHSIKLLNTTNSLS